MKNLEMHQRWQMCIAPLLLLALSLLELAQSFSLQNTEIVNNSLRLQKMASTTQLFSSPPPRQPRRMLKKRRNRQRQGRSITPAQQFPWDTAESRPLVKSISKEAGEDYWIDENDLKDFEQQQQAVKNRKALEGEVSKEKLWSEVKAPYKQNWIGYFSVLIFTLSVIIIKFPELLDQPSIRIPDL